LADCLVEGKQVIGALGGGGIDFLNVQADHSAAAFLAAFAPGGVEKDATHGLGRGAKEVSPAAPFAVQVGTDQANVGLVDESSRLKGLSRLFVRQVCGGELPQLLADVRQQFRRGLGIDLVQGAQDLGDIGHYRRIRWHSTSRDRKTKNTHSSVPFQHRRAAHEHVYNEPCYLSSGPSDSE